MQLFFKVTIEFPSVGSVAAMRRAFCFATKEEAGAFIGEMHTRGADLAISVVGTSIDHIMTGAEAAAEVAEEMDLNMRVAYSEAK